MKTPKLKQNSTPKKQLKSHTKKGTDVTDSRYEYLMLLNSDWIATQDNNIHFVRSIN